VLAVFIVTRNEAELLALNLAHHLQWGFDHVLIADNESTDATADVLRSFGDAVTSMRVARPNDRFVALSQLAHRIEDRLDGDSWIAFSDTDEFWWMPRRPLRALLDEVPAQVAVLNSPAKLFVPTGDDARVGPVYERLVHCATAPAAPPYAGYTGGKSLYRANWVLSHRVTDPHCCPYVPPARRRQSSKALVHHYMIDGEDDFVRTVTSLDRWGLPLGPTPRPRSGEDRLGETKKAWWRLYVEAGEAGLRAYYRSTYVVPATALPERLAGGHLVRDDAFAAYCRARAAPHRAA
jgi:hypothetical protein